jgi:hypothetical protein
MHQVNANTRVAVLLRPQWRLEGRRTSRITCQRRQRKRLVGYQLRLEDDASSGINWLHFVADGSNSPLSE